MKATLASYVTRPRLGQMALDLVISCIALGLGYLLRFEGQPPQPYVAQFLSLLPFVLLIQMVVRLAGGLHHQLWRFVNLQDAAAIALSNFAGVAALFGVATILLQTHVPWGIFAHTWWITVVGCIGVRVFRRLQMEKRARVPGAKHDGQRVLLIGAGQAGNTIAREIAQRGGPMTIVGFLDDDPTKHRSKVQGIAILGGTEDLPQVVSQYAVDQVILCIPSASQREMRRILQLARGTRASIKTLPGLSDLINGKIETSHIREVQIEDLLNRAPVQFDRERASTIITGRIVMITGAGGSIGSELCRQIAQLAPSRLILLGRGEFSIYAIEMELRERFPSLDMVPVIADVRDHTRMKRVFELHTPDVVFHAAAHKHVPLMEKNPSEAVFNNIFGTRIVAELAHQHNVERFVLISSDKAVNPTNVMGATKRIAELVVQDFAKRSETRFMSVRFGNVLGSRGSVIPLFKRQIAEGGPVTLTHPDIIRYFMTIPEATQLVLQAGGLGRGGEVFVLDMGEPVKIVDLARDLIRLSGFEPDVDIPIKFTGLRPGEKLFEELLTAAEGTSATQYRKIFVAQPEPIEAAKLELGLTLLHAAAIAGDDIGIRRGLKHLVTGYQFQAADSETPVGIERDLSTRV
jgi:FlaA1/EpsC-like NDP-sugar epimerase